MKEVRPAHRLIRLFIVLIISLSAVPIREVSAQTAYLKLNPSSGDPPAARGTLSGNGWCYPASSVVVSGTGVTGSAAIGRDGSLTGSFSVTGKAGDKVKIKVSATCRADSGSASAIFKFKGQSVQTPIPGTVDSPTPTFTLTPSPTSTSTSTPTFTPTFTFTPSPDGEGDGGESIVPYSGTNTLTLLGCDPQPQDLQLSFRRFLGNTQVLGQPIPVPVEPGSQPGLFVFEPPQADPGDLYEIDLRIISPDCPTEGENTVGLWTPGSSVQAVIPPAFGSTLLASSLGMYLPGSTDSEINLGGVWSADLEFSDTPDGHLQTFQWSTAPYQYQSGKLQASVLPFPGTTEGDLLSPPGLVAEWDVTCSDCEFTIDVSSLAFKPPQDSQTAAPKANIIQQVAQLIDQLITQLGKWIAGILGKNAQASPDLPVMKGTYQKPDNMVNLVESGKITPPLITTFYFRIVPLSGTDIAGPASTPVKIRWYGANLAGEIIQQGQECQQDPSAPGCPTPVPPPLKPYIVEIIGYHGIISPKGGHEGCYLVTKDTTVTYGPTSLTYKEGQKLCPPKPKEKSWYEAAIDFALDAVDWVSSAYNDLKDTVINIVAKFVPDALCSKACLGTLLDAGLMAIGMPPSIPNFDQLLNQGLDYLAAQAVGQLGIPQEVYDSIDPNLTGIALQTAISQAEETWKTEAENQIKQGLQQGLEAAQYALSESVSWVPDGVPIKPDPQGDYQPSTLLLKVTRDPSVPLEADTCSSSVGIKGNLGIMSTVVVSAEHAGNFNQWISSKNQLMQTNYPYYLYETMYVPLPKIAPGESQTVPVVLRPSMYDYWGSPWTSFNDSQSAWSTWYWNGVMNLSVSNPCTKGDVIQGFPDQSFGQ